MKVALSIVGGILVFIAVVVGLTEFGYRLDQHYQPRQEQVRHDTFENSATKVDGDARDISNLRLQYMSPGLSQDQKDAIRDIVRQRYCSLDPAKIPSNLLSFINQMCN
jgi:hypothetical protein